MKAPAILRTASDVYDVGDFLTLIKGAEANGRFFCLECKHDLTAIVKKIPNDGRFYKFSCPGCGRKRRAESGMLVQAAIAERQRMLDRQVVKGV